MSIKKPRISITFDKATINLLSEIAQNKQKSISNIVRELVLEALEHREDIIFSDIANMRDHGKIKRTKHNQVWK